VGEGDTDTFAINKFEVNLIREGKWGSESLLETDISCKKG